MLLYKDALYFKQDVHAVFDRMHDPGEDAPYPGIYGCVGCGREITLLGGSKLPPQNHHAHTEAQGRIRWQLRVTHE